MNCMDEMIFMYEYQLRNKADLIAYLKKMIDKYESAEEDELIDSERKKEVLVEVLKELLLKVECAFIPTLDDPMQIYKVCFLNDGISIEKVFVEDFEVAEDEWGEQVICSEAIEKREVLLKENCAYITVKEYAQMCDVSETTVRNWIRRGKLRHAKKVGRDWLIPGLYEKPERGYIPAEYKWEKLSDDIRNEFDFLPEAGSVQLYRGGYGEGNFIVTVYDIDDQRIDMRELLPSTCERLELKMIAAPEVEVDILFGPIGFEFYKSSLNVPWLSRRYVEFEDDELMMIKTQYLEMHQDFFENILYPEEKLEEDTYMDYFRPFELFFSGTFIEDDEIPYEAFDTAKAMDVAVLDGMLLLKEVAKDLVGSFIHIDEGEANLLNDLLVTFGLDSSNYNELFTILKTQEDVLLINELKFSEAALEVFNTKEEYMEDRMFDRILREIPSLINKKMAVRPHVLVHSLKKYAKEEEKQIVQTRYEMNGFVRLGDTELMYAYC